MDTGAEISVVPRSSNDNSQASLVKLAAANNTHINTYGQKQLTVDLGLQKNFTWIFTIADVTHPILGADFLKHFGMLVDVRDRALVRNESKLRSACKVSCQHQNITTIKSTSVFHDLLIRYTDLLKEPAQRKGMATHICHFIETKGPPVSQRCVG